MMREWKIPMKTEWEIHMMTEWKIHMMSSVEVTERKKKRIKYI